MFLVPARRCVIRFVNWLLKSDPCLQQVEHDHP
jgi:hypothetical protein